MAGNRQPAELGHEIDAWERAADRRLLDELDGLLQGAAAAAGSWVACRVGCHECCIGPFPITVLDARRLRRGLAELWRLAPSRARAVRRRAREAGRILRRGFPGTGVQLSDDEDRREVFLARHAALPCPALDPGTAGCDLYEARPLSCRTFGLPIRVAGEDLAPCRLCFAGAAPGETERCRVEPDPQRLEDAILARLAATGEPDRETLVAFALVDEGPAAGRAKTGIWPCPTLGAAR